MGRDEMPGMDGLGMAGHGWVFLAGAGLSINQENMVNQLVQDRGLWNKSDVSRTVNLQIELRMLRLPQM